MFDRQTLLEAMGDQSVFWSDSEEITAANQRRSDGSLVRPEAGRGSPERLGSALPARPWYEDQIPPFSIVLVGINEYGHQMEMQIRGVEILNSGQGISVDDLMIDQQMTFVATDIIPWRANKFIPPHSAQGIRNIAEPPAVNTGGTSLLGT